MKPSIDFSDKRAIVPPVNKKPCQLLIELFRDLSNKKQQISLTLREVKCGLKIAQ
jgi:hypothetical protein